jgi:hypothetical protein
MATTFLRRTTKNIGQTTATVGGYTVPTGKAATLVGVNLCNLLTVAVTANVAIANSSASLIYLAVNVKIPASSSFVPVGGDQKVILQVGDSVRVTANTASSVDAYISLVEGL